MRGILDGADLSQTTGRTVRAKVYEILGDRAGSDEKAFRNSVRDAITAVLNSANGRSGKKSPKEQASQLDNEPQSAQVEERPDRSLTPGSGKLGKNMSGKIATAPGSHAVPYDAQDRMTIVSKSNAVWNAKQVENREGKENSTQAAEDEAKMNDVSTSVTPTETVAAGQPNKPSRGMAIADLLGDASGHDADDENDVDNEQRDEQKRRRPSQKKRRSRPTLEDDGDDSDDSDEDAHELANSADHHDEVVADENRAKKGNRQVKQRRTSVLTSERDLGRLKDIIKQLGLKVPPAKVRRTISVAEKCAGLVEYLAEKGIDISNPTHLNKKEISMHRKRLENEKELAGLDERNIISDRRSRRARGSLLVHKPDDNELPSELSGEELSASSQHDEDSDEYQVSSQDSA